MMPLDDRQETILEGRTVRVRWGLTITPAAAIDGETVFNWSTLDFGFDGISYGRAIVPESFTGIEMSASSAESGIIAPSELVFQAVYDPEHAPDFEGATVVVREIVSDYRAERTMRAWKFRVRTACEKDGGVEFICEDILTAKLDAAYPPKPLVSDIFADGQATVDESACVPRIWGAAFIPLRPVYITGEGWHYFLGLASDTFTVSGIRAPDEFGASLYDNSFTYEQSSHAGLDGLSYRLMRPIIADTDNDGTADAAAVFPQGSNYLNLPAHVSEAASVARTSPEQVLEDFFIDIGCAAGDIDTGVGSSFAACAAVYAARGQSFKGGYFSRVPGRQACSELLAMADAYILRHEKVELYIHNNLSVKTVTSAHIRQRAAAGVPGGESTFKRETGTRRREYDSGTVAFSLDALPQSKLLKLTVPMKSAIGATAPEVMNCFLVSNSEHAVKLGCRNFQRKYFPGDPVSLELSPECLALCPADVITISDHDYYGPDIDVLIERTKHLADGWLQVRARVLTDTLDAWGDITLDGITPAAGADSEYWSPIYSGPDTTPSGGSVLNRVRGRFWVGDSILFDSDAHTGAGAIRVGTGLTHQVPFNIHDKLYYDDATSSLHADEMVLQVGTSILLDPFKCSGEGALQIGTGLTHDVPFNIHDKLYFDETDETLYARNLWISGSLHATVMEIDEMHAAGGTLLVSTGAALAAAVTTPAALEDDFVITVNDPASGAAQIYSVGDFIQMKVGKAGSIINAWMQVNDKDDDGYTNGYKDNGDGTGSYSVKLKNGDTAEAFLPGTAVVSWGGSAARKMLITSDLPDSPYLDIFTTGATPWSGVTSTTRLGNLAGITDDDFGDLTGEGLYSDHAYLNNAVIRGELEVIDGGDITLKGSDTDPARILFVDGAADETCILGSDADGAIMMLQPQVADTIDLYIGGEGAAFPSWVNGYYWKGIYMYAKDDFYLQAEYSDADNIDASITVDNTSGLSNITSTVHYKTAQATVRAYAYDPGAAADSGFLRFVAGNTGESTLCGVSLNHLNDMSLRPADGYGDSDYGALDLGQDVQYYWGDVFCASVDTTHDINFLDDHDDLGDLMRVGPLRGQDGRPVLDPANGNPIVDDATLPDYLCTRARKDHPEQEIKDKAGNVVEVIPAIKKGEIIRIKGGKTRGNNGAWYGWLMGAIRQFKGIYDQDIADLRAKIAELEAGPGK